MFVTSFYEIYGKPERISVYMELFKEIGQCGIPIIVFTDPSLVELFNNFPKTVRIIPLSLDTLEIYQIGMNYKRELPLERNKEKDTKEFYSLMNSKIEFIKKAAEYSTDEVLMWIDFGIMKIIRHKDTFLDRLKQLSTIPFTNITIPGCWGQQHQFFVEAIHWRFCGGFFVMPRIHIEKFYNNSKSVLIDFCKMPNYKLTWETNIWSIIEHSGEKGMITWYQADHNDSIIMNIPINQ